MTAVAWVPRVSWTAALLAALLLLGACSEPSDQSVPDDLPLPVAQGEVVVDGEPSGCPACSIAIERRMTLGSHTDLRLLREFPSLVVRDSRGYVYTVISAADHEVLAFNPDGTQVGVVGRLGAGPGEYRAVSGAAVTPGDSLIVFHDHGRVTAFGPEGELSRTFRSGPSRLSDRAFVRPDGHLVVSGWIEGADPSAASIHLISPLGEYLGSYERSPGDTGVSSPGIAPRLYSASQGGVWALPPSNVTREGSMRIQEYGENGELKRSVTLSRPDEASAGDVGFSLDELSIGDEVRELISARRAMGRSAVIPLSSTLGWLSPFELTGLHDLGSGRLLVTSRYLIEGWFRSALQVEPDVDGPYLFISHGSLPAIHRTVLDVIDVDSGELLIREVIPGFGQVLDDGTLVMMDAGPDGLIQLHLHDVRIDAGSHVP